VKFEDYYGTLGVARDASAEDIRKAYQRLARKYHPDVSKDAGGEEKFKRVSEAYKTLKDPDKRAAYDQLGAQAPGQDFRPPPGWEGQFGDGEVAFDDVDFADLFARSGAGAGRQGTDRPLRGPDYEAEARITLEQAFAGTVVEIHLAAPEFDRSGRLSRVERTIRASIPKGVTDGKRLRVPGHGGKGYQGGPDGDLYLDIVLLPHRLFRVDHHDLYIDLPLTPWEAALGAVIEVPTLEGPVELKVPPGIQAGRKLRLANRGLPRPREGAGNLYATVRIVMPAELSERERDLFKSLAAASTFDPRVEFRSEADHESRHR